MPGKFRESTVLERQEQAEAAADVQGDFAERRLHSDGVRGDRASAFFSKNREQATQIMLKVHREGRGLCGVYPRDIAATKVEQVVAFANEHQHPLQCVMEET